MVRRIVVVTVLFIAVSVGWAAAQDPHKVRVDDTPVTQRQDREDAQLRLSDGPSGRSGLFLLDPNSRPLALVKLLIAVSVTLVLAAIALPAQYKQERARRKARSKLSSRL